MKVRHLICEKGKLIKNKRYNKTIFHYWFLEINYMSLIDHNIRIINKESVEGTGIPLDLICLHFQYMTYTYTCCIWNSFNIQPCKVPNLPDHSTCYVPQSTAYHVRSRWLELPVSHPAERKQGNQLAGVHIFWNPVWSFIYWQKYSQAEQSNLS